MGLKLWLFRPTQDRLGTESDKANIYLVTKDLRDEIFARRLADPAAWDQG
jgi:hypothetical protein